ncbi:acyltransferase family protein [Planosporangium sp. 12N6]|uniref:acyltransferase family protein n=1 Tax=Planosporangium spinosum TaxID=3402278 RepID=UPI003CF99D0E
MSRPEPTMTPPTTERRTPRVESLTGLRWFAAFAVFLFHAGQMLPLPKGREIFALGDAGVTFFYILSGFVLTWSFSPDVGVRTFYWRRFARVWPMLAVSTVFAWLCFAQVWQESWKQTLLSLTLVESWFPPQGVYRANPVAWSISCEAFFYLVFPFLIRPIVRARLRVLAAVAAGLLFVEWAYWFTVRDFVDPANFWIDLSWLLRFPPYRLVEFLLGMVAAAALRQGWRPRINLWFALGLVPVGVLVLWQGAEHGWWQPLWSEQGLTPVFAVVVVAAALRDLNGQSSFLRSRPMVSLGAWSYAFYLVHLSVLYWFTKHVMPAGAGWSNLAPMLITAAATAVLAWICYRWIEHPTERTLRRLYPRRAVPARSAPAATVPAQRVPTTVADQSVDASVGVPDTAGVDLPR